MNSALHWYINKINSNSCMLKITAIIFCIMTFSLYFSSCTMEKNVFDMMKIVYFTRTWLYTSPCLSFNDYLLSITFPINLLSLPSPSPFAKPLMCHVTKWLILIGPSLQLHTVYKIRRKNHCIISNAAEVAVKSAVKICGQIGTWTSISFNDFGTALSLYLSLNWFIY